MLKKKYSICLQKVGVDTAENGPVQMCKKLETVRTQCSTHTDFFSAVGTLAETQLRSAQQRAASNSRRLLSEVASAATGGFEAIAADGGKAVDAARPRADSAPLPSAPVASIERY